MSAEEALATADREGLTLHRSESSTGFKGVSHHLSSSKVRPFHARVMRGVDHLAVVHWTETLGPIKGGRVHSCLGERVS